MNKKITLNYALIITALAVLLTFMITTISVDSKYRRKLLEVAESQKLYEKLNNVDKVVRSRYIGDIDETRLMDSIINGYIQGLGDKYSVYLPNEQFTALQYESQGKIVGIGVNVVYQNKLKVIEVTSVMKNSPAEAAGILPGDIITHVDDNYVSEIGYYAAIEKFPRSVGRQVNLIVRRGTDYSEELRFTLTSSIVDYPSIEGTLLDDGIGLIKIHEFTKATPDEFIKELRSLQSKGAKKFIFDVRNNPGGDLGGVKDTLDFLLPEGPILKAVSKDGQTKEYTSDANCTEAPMAVLISGSTVSAAELFAAALRDYDKAILVGEKTYGKGTMQEILGLPDNTGISISVKMYNPPFGENYEGVGVFPDIEASLNEEEMLNFHNLTPEQDRVLQAAIETLSE